MLVAPLAARSTRALWVTRVAAVLVASGAVLALSPINGGPEMVGAWAVLLGVLVALLVIVADRGDRAVTPNELRNLAAVAPLYGSLVGPSNCARRVDRAAALAHTDRALRAFRRGSWSRAVDSLTQAIAADPTLVCARQLAAIAMYRAHAEEAALPRSTGWRQVVLPDAIAAG